MSSVAIFRVKSCADSVFCWFCRSKISFNPDSSSLIFKSKFSVANSKRNFKKGSFTVFNVNERISYLDSTVRDMITVTTWKGPNTELFLVRIFLYSDWIQRFSPYRKIQTRKNSVFDHFSGSVLKWKTYQQSASLNEKLKSGCQKAVQVSYFL